MFPYGHATTHVAVIFELTGVYPVVMMGDLT